MAKTMKRKNDDVQQREAEIFALVDYTTMTPPTLPVIDLAGSVVELSRVEDAPFPSVRVLSDEEVAEAESASSSGVSPLEEAPLTTLPVLMDLVVEDVPVTGLPTVPKAPPAKKYGRFLSTDSLKVLVANPKRAGTKAHRRFRLYPTGDSGTVADYAAALERSNEAWRVRADLNWDTDYGHVLVTRDGDPV